jgi:imidazoleglycerol phosphate synthase glutamine amidotransferase subunit HisH
MRPDSRQGVVCGIYAAFMAREVTLVDAGLGNIASVERALIQVGGAVTVTRNPDEVAKSRCVVFPGQGAFGATTQNIIEGQMGDALRMVIGRGDPFLGICLGMQLLFDASDENDGQKGLAILPGRCRRFPDGMEVGAESGAQEIAPEAAEAKADPSLAQTVASEQPVQTAPAPAAEPSPTMSSTGGQEIPPPPAFPGTPAADMPSQAGQAHLPGMGNVGGIGHVEAAPEPPPPPAAPEPAPEPPKPEPVKLVRRLKVPHMGWNSVEPTGDHYYFVHSYYVEPETNDDVMWMTTYGGIRFPAAVRRDNILGCQFHPEKSQRAGLKFLRAFLLGGGG